MSAFVRETVEVPAVMRPDEVSEVLGVSRATLATWRCTGRYQLPYIRMGKVIRYRASDVSDLINRLAEERVGS